MLDTEDENVAYPAGRPLRGRAVNLVAPHVVVLFGATGDLARRKLLPGLSVLAESHAGA